MLLIGEMLFLILTHEYKRRHSLLSIDFATMLQGLARPEGFQDVTSGDDFEHEPSNHEKLIGIIQTHASAVVLAGGRAYKLKKPRFLASWTTRRLSCAVISAGRRSASIGASLHTCTWESLLFCCSLKAAFVSVRCFRQKMCPCLPTNARCTTG
jgi:hypothetical protein